MDGERQRLDRIAVADRAGAKGQHFRGARRNRPQGRQLQRMAVRQTLRDAVSGLGHQRERLARGARAQRERQVDVAAGGSPLHVAAGGKKAGQGCGTALQAQRDCRRVGQTGFLAAGVQPHRRHARGTQRRSGEVKVRRQIAEVQRQTASATEAEAAAALRRELHRRTGRALQTIGQAHAGAVLNRAGLRGGREGDRHQ